MIYLFIQEDVFIWIIKTHLYILEIFSRSTAPGNKGCRKIKGWESYTCNYLWIDQSVVFGWTVDNANNGTDVFQHAGQLPQRPRPEGQRQCVDHLQTLIPTVTAVRRTSFALCTWSQVCLVECTLRSLVQVVQWPNWSWYLTWYTNFYNNKLT